MKDALALPLQQHAVFATALRHLGRDVRLVTLTDAAPLVTVRVLGQMMASRGPIWAQGTDDQAKARALVGSGLHLLNADSTDDKALQGAGFHRLATPATVAELDLRGHATDRIAALQGKWRNRWRRAQDAPVTLQEQRFERTRHQWLLAADKVQQRQKRFSGLPHALILTLAAVDPEGVRVFVATHAGAPVAAMLFVLHRPVVTFHLGWISPAARQWSLHHNMLMAAATQFSEDGYHRLDLGLVDTETAAGLARFKIGSGAEIRTLGGSWLRLRR